MYRRSNLLKLYKKQDAPFKPFLVKPHPEGKAPYNVPENVNQSMKNGLQWVIDAQQANGGWGAGLHSRQEIKDPHAVKTDPATTAMVGMALLRCNNTLQSGAYTKQLQNALNFILDAVESSSANSFHDNQIEGDTDTKQIGEQTLMWCWPLNSFQTS